MKLNTENWIQKTGRSRRGVALIITLTIMALLLIMATAFVVNMSSERQISLGYRRQVESRQAALAGLATAIAKMDRFYKRVENGNASVATMAGRFYFTNYSTGGVNYNPNTVSNSMLMFSTILGTERHKIGAANWSNYADKVNLNMGNFKWPPVGGNPPQPGYYLPIANPSTPRNFGPDKVEIWAEYLQADNNSGYGSKFAFWIDDESSKINLSNAYGRDLAGAGINNTTNFGWVGSAATVDKYAAIIVTNQPAQGTQISTVDLSLLDYNLKASSGGGVSYTPNCWNNSAPLLYNYRNANNNQWQPLQGPEEVTAVANLTMPDYQAAKSCLTAWSVEKTDFSHYFRSNNFLGGRINVGNSITTQDAATKLYNLLVTTYNLPASPTLAQSFGSSKPTFQNKYKDTQQPFLNGNPSQIAANIVSYVMDPTGGQPPPSVSQLPAPYGSGSPLEIPRQYQPNASTVPIGPCGLWKAAYMNEIGLSFAWMPDGIYDGKTPRKWQLWASLCVELINPYEISLPISNVSYQEQYRIYFDSPIQVTVSTSNPSIPGGPSGPLAQPPTTLIHGPLIAPHSYTTPTTAYTNLVWTWQVTAISPTNVAPPAINVLSVKLPQQIRQMMWNSNSGSPVDRSSIIDWFSQTTQTKGGLPSLSTLTPTSLAAPQLAFLGAGLPPDPTQSDYWTKFWGANPTRVSIAKNDPRVHAWYGPNNSSSPIVTMGGMNTPNLDFTRGDNELNIYPPERRSNFVIANQGMRSVGELGFIHTGKPWRSLSLQYYGAQPDETGSIGSGATAVPDWSILDLFTVNTPPIYGRVNINTGGWHFGNNTSSTNGGTAISGPVGPSFEGPLQYPLQPNLVADWPDSITQWHTASPQWPFITMRTSAYNYYSYNLLTTPSLDVASVPLAAALNVIPPNNIVLRNKLVNYITHRRLAMTSRLGGSVQNNKLDTTPVNPYTSPPFVPYFSVAEICELPEMTDDFWSGNYATASSTDADKEEVIRRIIGVLTTHGDVFTVWVVGSGEGGVGWSNTEGRLMAVVERIRDTTSSSKSRWRILQIRWITD